MGFPVVLKIVSEQILHKSDAGGVIVGLEEKEDVRNAFNQIVERAVKFDPAAKIDGVLVQKMAEPGIEVILGVNRYPVFGPLLMVGMGGIFVEVFQDVAFRLAPIGRNEGRRMVRQIKGYRLLQGFRGKPKADVETIEKLLVGLSNMVINHPEIMELDINPLLVHSQGKGATAADCRIILKPTEESKSQ
jgi:acetyltransferase